MAKLELNLHTKTGDVQYEEHHVSGQKYLDLMNMKIEFEKAKTITIVDVLEERLKFTASLFSDKKVTAEAILQGTDPWELIPMLDRIEDAVLGVVPGEEKKEV